MTQKPAAKPDLIRPTDAEARSLAQGLLSDATHAALAVIDPGTSAPMVTRIALATGSDGDPVTLVSDLSLHTRALRANMLCSLLVGEPGTKGDPLTHPRLTLQCDANFVDQASDDHASLRARYLSLRPKARLYIDFADFRFVTFEIREGFLNGGFGKAYHLAKAEIITPKA